MARRHLSVRGRINNRNRIPSTAITRRCITTLTRACLSPEAGYLRLSSPDARHLLACVVSVDDLIVSRKIVDWDSLAKELDCAHQGGTKLAQQSITQTLGESFIHQAVDKALEFSDPGSELARSVLILLKSRTAIDYALRIYYESSDLESMRSALSLLKAISDRSIIDEVPEFLGHEDESIQNWGAAIVEQLAFSGIVSEKDCEGVLPLMERH